jgi:hypothetical protein
MYTQEVLQRRRRFFFCSHCTVTLLCDGAREWIHPKVPIWRRLFIDTLSRPSSKFLKHDTAGSHSALARAPPPPLLLLYIYMRGPAAT